MDGAKKIGIDGHMIGDKSGGNESYYRNILINMDFSQINVEVYLFLEKEVDASPFEGKYHIVRFESSNPFVRNFFELPKLCRKYDLSLLHTQYFIPFYRPCPVVCTIHDICFEHYRDIFTKKEYIRQKLLIPYAAKHSEKIFTVSEHAKRDISNQYAISDNKVVVTYNAVNNSFKKLDDKELQECELRSRFKIGNTPFVLCVGNLQPRKNLPRMIKAYRKYVELEKADVKLVVVGKKAWMYDDILKETMQGIDDVILTDYVSESDLVRLYNASVAFIYPSYFEGFGIPPLEALACGTPVAVSNATALPEVVGDAGVYFDPFDETQIVEALQVVISNEKVRKDIIDKATERVKFFSWKKSAEIIVGEYCKILNE